MLAMIFGWRDNDNGLAHSCLGEFFDRRENRDVKSKSTSHSRGTIYVCIGEGDKLAFARVSRQLVDMQRVYSAHPPYTRHGKSNASVHHG